MLAVAQRPRSRISQKRSPPPLQQAETIWPSASVGRREFESHPATLTLATSTRRPRDAGPTPACTCSASAPPSQACAKSPPAAGPVRLVRVVRPLCTQSQSEIGSSGGGFQKISRARARTEGDANWKRCWARGQGHTARVVAGRLRLGRDKWRSLVANPTSLALLAVTRATALSLCQSLSLSLSLSPSFTLSLSGSLSLSLALSRSLSLSLSLSLSSSL